MIPPQHNSEFVAAMEDVLELYRQPYDPALPMVCMDEHPMQLQRDVRPPIPATAEHPQRIDYEYERAGTASVFMVCEPLAGWRQVNARAQRTKVDWATTIATLLDTRYQSVQRLRLVCDNLNTHTPGAFYETFAPAQARAYVQRLEFHYTPKHGSWLNIAECELSALTRQCVAHRRIDDLAKLQMEIQAWADATNHQQRGVLWQFNVHDARHKLHFLYPKILI
ncbi:MAG: IS630 family transposase [Prochlorothrix sp.]|nr:IS630 family transposase [Prochlorothrix sp.]